MLAAVKAVTKVSRQVELLVAWLAVEWAVQLTGVLDDKMDATMAAELVDLWAAWMVESMVGDLVGLKADNLVGLMVAELVGELVASSADGTAGRWVA